MKYSYNQDIGLKKNLLRLVYKSVDILGNIQSLTLIQTRKEFPAFWPNSAGSASQQKKLAIQTIQNVLENLQAFSTHKVITVEDFRIKRAASGTSCILGDLLKMYGSDKSTSHNYDLVYEALFSDPEVVRKVFEVGIGSNNSKIISNMGPAGHPGSSLRALRDYFPNSEIIGVDIDKETLFQEERIRTHFLDQLDLNSFQRLSQKIGDNFDLMIDDGLHTIDANLNTLNFFIPRLTKGGYAVVEDIPAAAHSLWLMMCRLLSNEGDASLVDTRNGLLFVFKKN